MDLLQSSQHLHENLTTLKLTKPGKMNLVPILERFKNLQHIRISDGILSAEETKEESLIEIPKATKVKKPVVSPQKRTLLTKGRNTPLRSVTHQKGKFLSINIDIVVLPNPFKTVKTLEVVRSRFDALLLPAMAKQNLIGKLVLLLKTIENT